MADAALYSIRPPYKEKFPPAQVKKIIGTFLSEYLGDKLCAVLLGTRSIRGADGHKFGDLDSR